MNRFAAAALLLLLLYTIVQIVIAAGREKWETFTATTLVTYGYFIHVILLFLFQLFSLRNICPKVFIATGEMREDTVRRHTRMGYFDYHI